MKNKLLSVLAVIAVAFASVAVVTEINNVDAASAITIDEDISGGTVTASATSAEADVAITLTVTPDANKQLKAGSLSVKITSSSVAVPLIGFTFTMPSEPVTVTAEFEDITYAPTSFAYGYDAATAGVYNGMKVIGYGDKTILIDTNAMALTASQNAFYVGLNPGSTAAEELKVGPVVAQNGRIWIDASGKNIATTPKDLLTDGADTLITLYAYDTGAAISYATLTWEADVAQLSLKTNHNSDWTKVNFADLDTPEYVAYDDVKYLRTTDMIVLDETITVAGESPSYPFNAFAYGYELRGWSLTYVADSKIVMTPTANGWTDGTHTTPSTQTDFVTIEEIIFAMADHITKNNVLDGEDALINPIDDSKITLFAIWEEILYTIEVGDQNAVGALSGEGEFANPFEFGTNNVRLNPNGDAPNLTQDGFASVTSKVSKNSFALLRMQQDNDAAFDNAPQYTYTIKVYYATVNPDTGVKTWALAGEYQDADDAEDLAKYVKIDMINNGIYKISKVKADLRITVLMGENTGEPATNAYAFQIDQIKNDNTSAGFVNLSLDLFDYTARYADNGNSDDLKLVETQQIAIEGTYYKTLGTGTSAQRVYGDLKNIAVTAKAYVDLKENDTQLADYQVDEDRVVNDRALQLTNENSVYDLSYQLGTGVSIYAAQGVWNTLNYDNAGDFEGFDDDLKVVKTPWALYKAIEA